MQVEPAAVETREKSEAATSSAGSMSAAGHVVRSVQNQVNHLRKVETKLRKTDQDLQDTHDKWMAWQKEMTKSYAKEKAKYKTMMDKLNEERQDLQESLEEVLGDLQQAMLVAGKQSEKKEDEVPAEILAEWENLVDTPLRAEPVLSDLVEEALSGKASIRPKEAEQLIAALKNRVAPTEMTPPRRTTRTTAMTPPATSRRDPTPMDTTEAKGEEKVYQDATDAASDPYLTSPSVSGLYNLLASAGKKKTKIGQQRMPIKALGRQPTPLPAQRTPLAQKLEKIREKSGMPVLEIDGETDSEEDQPIGELGPKDKAETEQTEQ
ncbi:unnamed protein product, partial [Symbiodinium sp. CCMP2456]